jgi:prepilin-type processing-associated H-X9-DG protein
MRQIGNGYLMYSQDYDETLPPQFIQIPSGTGVKPRWWPALVESYIKSGGSDGAGNDASLVTQEKASIFICPDFGEVPPAKDEVGNASLFDPAQDYPLLSYMPNFWAVGRGNTIGTVGWQDWRKAGELPTFADPANLVLLVETKGANPGGALEVYGYGGANNYTRAGRRHAGGMNYTFVDGHVKWYKGGTQQYGPGGTTDQQWTGSPVCVPVAGDGTPCRNKPRFFPRAEKLDWE